MPPLPEPFDLPPELVDSLSAVPGRPPATPRDSASVVLVRDHPAGGVEVFLMRRAATMAFAPGMTVFPGGSVDGRDRVGGAVRAHWAGPAPEWWAERFGCAPDLAAALVSAAVRETFEETGVLLAGADDRDVVRDAGRYSSARPLLESGALSLGEFLAANELVLRADLLTPWANWVTPEVEARRHDTRFFLAELPPGQRADGRTSEAVQARWLTPAAALEEWRQGDRALLPPTWVTLSELADQDSVSSARRTPRVIGRTVPRIIREGGRLRVVVPEPSEGGPGRHEAGRAPTVRDERADGGPS
ncbi:NUDIX hydrolase [Actinoalloteichus sp. AHMU CJ021]|uniref:NUDIX hydrolase n=1 Tax=Actinoalloteichus TaxID=65496 RepID=UPI0004258103|nr:NUDIX hydrolase [Actinoalloteichus caeruleus]AUS78606.1 NUDIX hydrolase [Actinoalloteichus sp. AHMU CJ021]